VKEIKHEPKNPSTWFITGCATGFGRELSHFGAHAFVNAQTVWIENV